MNVETLLENATEHEASVILAIVGRMQESPAVLVTVGGRRYVVAQEDESLFADIPNGPTGGNLEDRLGRFSYFGAQWLRGFGRVDEMYRTLSAYEVTRVARENRRKVWGDR